MGPEDRRRTAILLAIFPSVALALLNGLYLEPLYDLDPRWYWTADLVQYAAVPAGALYYLSRIARIQPREYGFAALRGSASENIGLFLFVAAAYWLSYKPVVLFAYAWFRRGAPAFTVGIAIAHAPVPKLALAAYMALTAAFVEEAVFRGLPWLYLRRLGSARRRVPIYVLGTALVFGASHSEQGPHGVIAAFSLGLVSAFLYSKVQNLWPFVTAHFAFDLLAFWPR